MASVTYTMRIDEQDHKLLVRLADILNTTVADLSREILREGVRDRLNPEAIDRRIEIERKRLHDAAQQLLEEVGYPRSDEDAESDTEEPSDSDPVTAGATRRKKR